VLWSQTWDVRLHGKVLTQNENATPPRQWLQTNTVEMHPSHIDSELTNT